MRHLLIAAALILVPALAYADPSAEAASVPGPGPEAAPSAHDLTKPVEMPKAERKQVSDKPKEQTVNLRLTGQEARDLVLIFDKTIRASGYDPLTVKALQIGQKVEQAAAEAGPPPDGAGKP